MTQIEPYLEPKLMRHTYNLFFMSRQTDYIAEISYRCEIHKLPSISFEFQSCGSPTCSLLIWLHAHKFWAVIIKGNMENIPWYVPHKCTCSFWRRFDLLGYFFFMLNAAGSSLATHIHIYLQNYVLRFIMISFNENIVRMFPFFLRRTQKFVEN